MNSFHTHTYRCKHAAGDVDQYVTEALKNGSTRIGISDHTPLPDSRWLSVRMEMEELEGYIQAIENARKTFPDIEIHSGLECEYADEYVSFYKDYLLDECKFDYLISGAHYIPYKGEWQNIYGRMLPARELAAYAQYVVSSIKSGLFSFIAHPDLFANSYLTWDDEAIAASRDILAAAESCNVPLELNSYGFRKPPKQAGNISRPPYPLDEFWQLAEEYNIKVVINADAHRPQDVTGAMDQAFALAEKYNLSVIEPEIKK